ncbi:MAG: nucleotidyltransferase family protein [Bacteroidetes bacterium]|nr:nucleotidyltransferase family protein [Bacteroidota bacterium]
MLKTSAIVLAAGQSSRMEGFKLGLPFKQHTILDEVLTNLASSNVHEIIVVSGHYQKETEEIANRHKGVKRVHNPHYETGMSSSIKAGIEAADPKANGLMICLSDMPFIRAADYESFRLVFEGNYGKGPIIIRPFFEGKPGHPVIFSDYFRSRLLSLEYEEGARQLIRDNQGFLIKVEADSGRVLKDIDTPGQYEEYIGEK